MLFDRLDSVRKKMNTVTDAKRNKNLQDDEAKRNKSFFASYDNMVKNLQSYLLVKERLGFNISISTETEIKNLLNEIKSIFDEKKVINPYELNRKIERLNAMLKNDWINCSQDKLGIVDNMELLKIISDNRIRLQGIIMELVSIKEWPVTLKSVERYEKAYKLAKDEIADRQFSEEVSTFLKKVQIRKATLKDLTANVQEWIISEGLEDKICLSIATK